MTKTRSEYINGYARETYDRIPVQVPKGYREIIRSRAAALDLSVNAYILRLIRADMQTASQTAKASPETETE